MPNTTQLRKNFDTGDFKIGASWFKQFCWYFTSALLFKSRLIPFSSVLTFFLRLFGARIGNEVRIKPGIYIKYPWKLSVGNYSWLADCYIDNLAEVNIGTNCCISQQAVLITGNHNYKKPGFNLITKPIILDDGVWVGAGAMVCPGVNAHSHAVLAIGSVATTDLEPYKIYQGNPAVSIRTREIE